MSRTLTAAALAALIAVSALSPAQAATEPAPGASAPAKAKVAKKPVAKVAKVAEPVATPNDHLNPGQLSAAGRVLTGDIVCEFKQKVVIEKIPGHEGNFKLVYEHKSYVMYPEETTTGAVRLVDAAGDVIWVQIPMKSMLMNQREHHRMVDDCEAAEQRVAAQQAATVH